LLDVIEDAHGASLGARGHGGTLPTQAYRYDRLASCQRTFFDACVAAGYPAARSSPIGGVELGCANIVGATRWNAAFAFLDPVRELPTLTIMDNMLVDRLRFEGRRATGVVCRSPDGTKFGRDASCFAQEPLARRRSSCVRGSDQSKISQRWVFARWSISRA
jgi:choline dehydrogenase-like flavoprotein